MIHTFILGPRNAEHRQSCHEYIKALDDRKPWKVIISEYVKDRGTDANAAYWAGTITPAAGYLGYESVKELHRQICMELYGTRKVAFAGKVYDEPMRTTTTPTVMTKAEFSEHMERAAALLTAQGVVLPSRDHWFTGT